MSNSPQLAAFPLLLSVVAVDPPQLAAVSSSLLSGFLKLKFTIFSFFSKKLRRLMSVREINIEGQAVKRVGTFLPPLGRKSIQSIDCFPVHILPCVNQAFVMVVS